jgi:aldehyde dehydrogenase (NAD+)
VPSAPDRSIDVIDPADTRRVVARVPAMLADEVTELYETGVGAAPAWADTPALDRAAILSRAAELLRVRSREIVDDLVAEMGKTRAEATVEVAKSADFFDFYSGLTRTPYGSLLNDPRPGVRTEARLEPVGVVCAITPWNDPLLTPARKLAPALSLGNVVILKPAMQTPVVAIHLARALDDAGLPAGVLGLALGGIKDIADALLDDPRLDAVSFTGSTAVGTLLRRRLSTGNVRLQTEMGGKNASVVLADADLDLAATTIAGAAFGQSGQRCTATSRVVAEVSIIEDVTKRLCGLAESMQVGPGDDPATTMGPLVGVDHRDEVLTHLGRATSQGALIATGGEPPTREDLAHGCYVQPTVLTDVTPTMSIWRDEVFGPVVAVRSVDTFDDAVRATNDSEYGLAAAVFTRSLARAHEFADRANVGQVSINLPTSGWDVHLPFGGFGASGSAFKEQGTEGLRFYSRVKTVAIRYGG